MQQEKELVLEEKFEAVGTCRKKQGGEKSFMNGISTNDNDLEKCSYEEIKLLMLQKDFGAV